MPTVLWIRDRYFLRNAIESCIRVSQRLNLFGLVVDGYSTQLGIDQVNCNKVVKSEKGYVQSYYYAFENMPAQLNSEILKTEPLGSNLNPIISITKLACDNQETVCEILNPEIILSFNEQVSKISKGYEESATLNFEVVCCEQ